MVSEADLIARRYARRDLGTDGRRYSMLSPDNWQKMHERQRAVLRLFARLGFRDLSQLNLLEVGAGAGGGLLEFLRIGFSPERLAGIELLPDRVTLAPPIARRLAIMHPGLYPVANVFPFLRTHLLCWIQKPS